MHESSGPIVLADPVDRSHPLNRGRVAWWLVVPGLEGGRRWFDLMGLNHGALTNLTTPASGWRGTTRPGGWGHILFDGVDDIVTAPALSPPTFTLAAWGFKTAAGNGVIVAQANSSVSLASYYLRIANGSGFHAGSGYREIIVPDCSLNAWHHHALTYDGATLRYYLDGAAGVSGAATGTPDATTNPCTIGRFGDLSAQYWPGPLDDVAAWDRALSAAEMGAIYDLSRRGYPGVLRRLGSRAWRSAPAGPGPLAASYYQRRRRGA